MNYKVVILKNQISFLKIPKINLMILIGIKYLVVLKVLLNMMKLNLVINTKLKNFLSKIIILIVLKLTK